MKEHNLPIKLIMQRSSDSKKNIAGGGDRFFCAFTPELQSEIISGFESILTYYGDVFESNPLVPAVGKITVIPEAIAKSHKPNALCRKCPIIGSEELGEIYIKVTKDTIEETVELVRNPSSKGVKANMTAISTIEPIVAESKVSLGLKEMNLTGKFELIKNRVKIKLFDFGDDFDNEQIMSYVMKKLDELGFLEKHELFCFQDSIKYIKVSVSSYDDVLSIAEINGVKSVDFFQEYSLPLMNSSAEEILNSFQNESVDSDVIIGIIDGGIGDNNPLISPYVIAKEKYVSDDYQNHNHASFIASTIQFGNELNSIASNSHRRFKFLDVIAIPNSDPKHGPTDTLGEIALMEIIEEVMEKYSETVKIWNLSLGIENQVCNGSMSDLGVFLDTIQEAYNVQIFVSSGNLKVPPLRRWPPQSDMGERDRIISPADSVRAITVGSLALYDSENSIVKRNEPSPFSRRGPGANYITKPTVVDYGGNLSTDFKIEGLGMKGLDPTGMVVEGNGTSYSTPRAVQKYATILDEMVDKDILLAKAMLIHSARWNSRDLLNEKPENINYYGFGMPSDNIQDVLRCSEDEVTLVFRQKILQGTHLEMLDFPFPNSLIKNGKYYGEIGMTLVYDAMLDEKFGQEYCRVNIDASFGVFKTKVNGDLDYKGQVPLEYTWDEKYEQARVENGFKWSPVKSYYRKIKNGIQIGDGWKIRLDMTTRNEATVPEQEFVLIITIKDSTGNDIYTEIVNELREKGYITNNLETRYQIRQRQ